MASTKQLRGQVAIVTGADSGIGKAVAIAFAAAGATVIVNHVDSDEHADEVVDLIKKAGGKAYAFHADVSREDDVKAMFAFTIKKYKTVDILVNNAGLQKDASFVDMSLDDWNTVLGVNLTGQFLCSREAAKEFIRRGVIKNRSVAAGKIICMSSVHEIIPWAGHVNYAASKGGVSMFMKSIAQELAPHKIRVVGIGPGAIQTPINQEAWETPQALNKLLKLIPYNRIGQPGDIGKLAVWLASDEADYITGTTVLIDGGMTLYPGFADNG